MAIQNIGRVSIVAKGTYIASETYEKLDLVVFNDASYLCRKTCSGIEPIAGTVTDYWQPFADSIEILATKEEVEANTDSGKVADALVVKGLSAEVTELNCGLSQLGTIVKTEYAPRFEVNSELTTDTHWVHAKTISHTRGRYLVFWNARSRGLDKSVDFTDDTPNFRNPVGCHIVQLGHSGVSQTNAYRTKACSSMYFIDATSPNWSVDFGIDSYSGHYSIDPSRIIILKIA